MEHSTSKPSKPREAKAKAKAKAKAIQDGNTSEDQNEEEIDIYMEDLVIMFQDFILEKNKNIQLANKIEICNAIATSMVNNMFELYENKEEPENPTGEELKNELEKIKDAIIKDVLKTITTQYTQDTINQIVTNLFNPKSLAALFALKTSQSKPCSSQAYPQCNTPLHHNPPIPIPVGGTNKKKTRNTSKL